MTIIRIAIPDARKEELEAALLDLDSVTGGLGYSIANDATTDYAWDICVPGELTDAQKAAARRYLTDELHYTVLGIETRP